MDKMYVVVRALKFCNTWSDERVSGHAVAKKSRHHMSRATAFRWLNKAATKGLAEYSNGWYITADGYQFLEDFEVVLRRF